MIVTRLSLFFLFVCLVQISPLFVNQLLLEEKAVNLFAAGFAIANAFCLTLVLTIARLLWIRFRKIPSGGVCLLVFYFLLVIFLFVYGSMAMKGESKSLEISYLIITLTNPVGILLYHVSFFSYYSRLFTSIILCGVYYYFLGTFLFDKLIWKR